MSDFLKNLLSRPDPPSIDADEFDVTYETILRRETEEEVGQIEFKIKPKPAAIGRHEIPSQFTSSKKGPQRVLYVFFEADYLGGDIKISDEHEGYDWLDIEKNTPDQYFKSGILEGIKMYLSE
ncbi:NUDIX domain-containing protein [Patescibacteria group bacterium]